MESENRESKIRNRTGSRLLPEGLSIHGQTRLRRAQPERLLVRFCRGFSAHPEPVEGRACVYRQSPKRGFATIGANSGMGMGTGSEEFACKTIGGFPVLSSRFPVCHFSLQ